MVATKIHEWSIAGQPAELWNVKGKLQIRHRGTIHNTGIPLDREIDERKAGKWIEDGYHNLPCVCSYCGHEGMTRENLIEAIYANNSEWSCPIYKGCIHNCRKCAENQLEQYEKAIYDRGYEAGMKKRARNDKSDRDK